VKVTTASVLFTVTFHDDGRSAFRSFESSQDVEVSTNTNAEHLHVS
jgi:hypothetical protein